MKYKLARHDEVRFDVAAILDLVGNYAGYKTGGSKVKEIRKSLFQLTEFPHSGVRRDDISTGSRAIQSGEKAMI